MKFIECVVCSSKARSELSTPVSVNAPMHRTSKEEVYHDDKLGIWYKFIFTCPICNHQETIFGKDCLFCGGMGYHCHVSHGTTCSSCRGTGIFEVPESYIHYLKGE